MARKSRELKAQGIDVISLSLGEPDLIPLILLKKQLRKALIKIIQNTWQLMAMKT